MKSNLQSFAVFRRPFCSIPIDDWTGINLLEDSDSQDDDNDNNDNEKEDGDENVAAIRTEQVELVAICCIRSVLVGKVKNRGTVAAVH